MYATLDVNGRKEGLRGNVIPGPYYDRVSYKVSDERSKATLKAEDCILDTNQSNQKAIVFERGRIC